MMRMRMYLGMTVLVWVLTAALPAWAEGQRHGVQIEFSVQQGSDYTHTKWFFLIPVKLTPQMACWVETEEGEWAAPVYVTEKTAAGAWKGGGGGGRPEALPVYSHARKAQGGAEDGTDAVSGATPAQGEGKEPVQTRTVFLAPGKYRILAEVNSSFDYNGAYPETQGDVNGQPSLVYAGNFRMREGGRLSSDTLNLSIIGHGDAQGRTGRITPGTEGLTTALEQVAGITVRLQPMPQGSRGQNGRD